ncbi:unnamed protein product, partial [Linum tenue]
KLSCKEREEESHFLCEKHFFCILEREPEPREKKELGLGFKGGFGKISPRKSQLKVEEE